jgi:Siphovirus Gp157
MEVAELKKLATPAATLSLKANPPSCVVYDEDILPKQYLVFQAPKPDKNAIKAALKAGESVPGASLSNQPDSLSVRFT